ncbi:Motility protein B, N-terminal domain containing protein [Desulfovibrio sp. X2]|uniref:OmpA/MotB family protein n=1 Tax=Desulfovibrio sp. X2 TaxID=941449 RepID=UPI000358AB12|nr:flagellar motor protein MotB [Desulfovibrio sp. X2]EPR44031.1 Motility protein B, N-terminal domain containing protein [Desulfovibrio sp. X2]
MARRKRAGKAGGDELPGWFLTFSDMMTLLLTFFVLLNAMAVIDERRKLVAIGSIIGTFGEGSKSVDVLTRKDTKQTVESGPMEGVGDLEPLKQHVWDDIEKDVSFAESRYVQVFSISADVLFEPGGTTLAPRGEKLLEDLLPVLDKVRHPVLLAGNTSSLRDEMGEAYRPSVAHLPVDPSWRISLGRALAVYRFLLGKGVPSQNLRVEGFGRFHPRFDAATPEGRRMNRRVDLVLDKRSPLGDDLAEAAAPGKGAAPGQSDSYEYGGFVFELGSPRTGQQAGNGAGNRAGADGKAASGDGRVGPSRGKGPGRR